MTKQVPEWIGKHIAWATQAVGLQWRKGLAKLWPFMWNDLCCLPADSPTGRVVVGAGRHELEECDFPCVMEYGLHLSEPLLPRFLKKTQVEEGIES